MLPIPSAAIPTALLCLPLSTQQRGWGSTVKGSTSVLGALECGDLWPAAQALVHSGKRLTTSALEYVEKEKKKGGTITVDTDTNYATTNRKQPFCCCTKREWQKTTHLLNRIDHVTNFDSWGV